MDSDDEFEWFLREIECVDPKTILKQDPNTVLEPTIDSIPPHTDELEVQLLLDDTADDIRLTITILSTPRLDESDAHVEGNSDAMLEALLQEIMVKPPTADQQSRVDAYHKEHNYKLQQRYIEQISQQQAHRDAVSRALASYMQSDDEEDTHTDTVENTEETEPETCEVEDLDRAVFGRTADKSMMGMFSSWANTTSMIPERVIQERGPVAFQQRMMLHMALAQDNMSATPLPPELLGPIPMPPVQPK